MTSSPKKQDLSSEKLSPAKQRGVHHLVLHNDDVHTFDFVIDSLIRICNHEPEQAEQCAIIVHHKGKCVVKSEKQVTLIPMLNALRDLGLSAVIE